MSEDRLGASSIRFDNSNMFEPLLQADPSFRGRWETFREEYRSEDDLPLYLALSELARHLIQDLETGNTFRFEAVFDVVERWHVEGDRYVKEAATVGLLEDLQNGHLHRSTHPKQFEPWLRAETRRWWGKVSDFWASGKPLV